MTTKLWLMGVATLVVFTMVYLGYRHYTGLLEENATLRDNNTKFGLALDTQKKANERSLEVIEEWKQHGDALILSVQEMQNVAVKAQSENRRLNDIFSKHDLTALSLAKPGLVERRINSGVDNINRMFECETSEGGCGDAKPGEAKSKVPVAKSRGDETVGSEVVGDNTE